MKDLSDKDREYMLYFADICDNAKLEYGEDRAQFINVDVAGDCGIYVKDIPLPRISGQVISSAGAAKLGKYIADKLGDKVGEDE